MLKLIYTDESFRLERLSQSVESWVKDRAVLALRTTQNFYLEPSSASFLILSELPMVADLENLQKESDDILAIARCDAEYSEVSLNGHWMTNGEEECNGVFICSLGDHAEKLLQEIWLASEYSAPVPED